MEKEIFKDIKGYEGIYQVSNYGNVKSLKYNKEKILKKAIANTGYYVVNLSNKNKAKLWKVHQLVAMAFLQHKPCGYNLVVDHINHNPLDNNVKNLRVVTHRQNISYQKRKKSSKYTGVYWGKSNKKWRASIQIKGKTKHLGSYSSEIKASKAYKNALNNL